MTWILFMPMWKIAVFIMLATKIADFNKLIKQKVFIKMSKYYSTVIVMTVFTSRNFYSKLNKFLKTVHKKKTRIMKNINESWTDFYVNTIEYFWTPSKHTWTMFCKIVSHILEKRHIYPAIYIQIFPTSTYITLHYILGNSADSRRKGVRMWKDWKCLQPVSVITKCKHFSNVRVSNHEPYTIHLVFIDKKEDA